MPTPLPVPVLMLDAAPMFSGAQRVALRVLMPLVRQGRIRLTAWCAGEMAETLRREGITAHEEPLPFLMPGYDSPLTAWRKARPLQALAHQRAGGSAVYANGVHSGIAAAFLGLRGPQVRVHARDVLRPRPPTTVSYRWMRARGFRFAGVSNVVSQNIRQLSGAQAVTLYDPAPTMMEERPLADTVRKIVFTGNLIHFKGPDLLLKALNRLPPELTRALTVDLIGPELPGHEDYAAEVRRLAEASPFACRLLGRQENIMNRMRDYDLAVLPSTWPDPFPGVVLEAVASFTPLVASRVGGVPEMQPPEAGPDGPWLSAPSPDALAATLRTAILSSPEDRLRRLRASRAWATERFSEAVILDQTLDFLS